MITEAIVLPPNFGDLLNQYSTQNGVDPSYANAIMQIESGGRPGLVSPAGARGLMQIMPDTARQYGFNPDQLQDPSVNLQAGTRILGDLMHRYNGDPYLTAVAYNAGPGWADKLRAGKIGWNAIPAESQGYVQKLSSLLRGNGASSQQTPANSQPTGMPTTPASGINWSGMGYASATPTTAAPSAVSTSLTSEQPERGYNGSTDPTGDFAGTSSTGAEPGGTSAAPTYSNALSDRRDATNTLGLALRGWSGWNA